MKKFAAITAVVFAMALGMSGAAQAAPGWTSNALNLRAGPGVNYPLVARIPEKASVEVEGCLENWSWCNVFWRGKYGWTSGRHIELKKIKHHGGPHHASSETMPPVVVYNVNEYWDRHYRDAPFYAMRAQYGYNVYPVPVPVNNRPPMDRTGGDYVAKSVHNRISHMRDDRWYESQ